jgi:putative ABC transport system substrate-binding protein
MNRKIGILVLGTLLSALSHPTNAQQSRKVTRIGFLVYGSPDSYAARVEAFRQGLRELGYVEGKNIAVDYKYAEKDFDKLVAEMIRTDVDIIVAGGTPPASAAKKATKTIPIVVAVSGDTVGSGLVASLARPGGNVTGLTSVASDLSGKRLELIKEVHPKVSRVAVLSNPLNPSHPPQLKEAQGAAGALNVTLQILEARRPDDLEGAVQSALRERAEALIVLPEGLFTSQRKRILGIVATNKLATIYYDKEFVEAGGLLSYGVSFPALFHRAAIYVDKILKGAKPADLPVEQPTKFELIINLRTAKQIGLTIPPNVLARADRVIK